MLIEWHLAKALPGGSKNRIAQSWRSRWNAGFADPSDAWHVLQNFYLDRRCLIETQTLIVMVVGLHWSVVLIVQFGIDRMAQRIDQTPEKLRFRIARIEDALDLSRLHSGL